MWTVKEIQKRIRRTKGMHEVQTSGGVVCAYDGQTGRLYVYQTDIEKRHQRMRTVSDRETYFARLREMDEDLFLCEDVWFIETEQDRQTFTQIYGTRTDLGQRMGFWDMESQIVVVDVEMVRRVTEVVSKEDADAFERTMWRILLTEGWQAKAMNPLMTKHDLSLQDGTEEAILRRAAEWSDEMVGRYPHCFRKPE